MPLRFFGFQIGKDKPNKADNKSFAIPQNEDGAITIQAGGIYGTYVDLEGTSKNEIELITRYREMSLQPECEAAIEDIVDESIVIEEDEPAVKIMLDKLPKPYNAETIKQKIQDEFDSVLRLLNFRNEGHDIFKRWYIDGRSYYHMIIDDSAPAEGIQELRYIDPRRIRKVREIRKKLNDQGVEIIDSITEYYVYNERGLNNAQSTTMVGIKIAPDSICNAHSGLVDATRNMVLSWLHKAIKPLNQLRMIEDAVVIYRISRAPERRIFYIDVGNLPKIKAEQYLKDIMNKYRNKLVYDANTGELRDDKKFLSMMEDYWLPRREGGKGTEIDTLPGGENLGQMTDVEYFQEKLYKALNVPVSRLKSDSGFSLGRSAEISRDELKFFKFISRLRNRFSHLFDKLLRTQLLLKGVIENDDWDVIKQFISYDFAKDSYFTELKESEVLQGRMILLSQVDPYIGKYFSMDYIRRNILHMNEDEIKDMQTQMEKERPELEELLDTQATLIAAQQTAMQQVGLAVGARQPRFPTQEQEVGR